MPDTERWEEPPVGPSPLRSILADVLRESVEPERVLIHCSCGQHNVTAALMVTEIETGTRQGREYAMTALRMARDFVGLRGLPADGMPLSEEAAEFSKGPAASVLEDGDTSLQALPGGPDRAEMAVAVRGGTDEGRRYVEGLVAKACEVLRRQGGR